MLRSYEGAQLLLITPDEYDALPDGVILHSIYGEEAIKGYDEIDWNITSDHLHWGLMTRWADFPDDTRLELERRKTREPRQRQGNVNDYRKDYRRRSRGVPPIAKDRYSKHPTRPTGAERRGS